MASTLAWSPSVVTSGVVAAADSGYLLLILCAVGMEHVLLPWLGFVYQLAEKPGWCLVPTFYGGFVPLQVVSLSGESGLLAAFEAPDPWFFGDVMATGHLLRPGCSTSIQHVDVFGVRLLVASKNYEVPSSGRRLASSCTWLLRSPATRTTDRILQGLSSNFCFLHVCLCKMWNVNFKKSM
jgi:hypothetical protein